MPSARFDRYDAFLSYKSEDSPAVRQVARQLRDHQLTIFLAEWELAPGREFQPALAQALQESKTCVVLLGQNGLGPWQKEELQIALEKRAQSEDFRVIPVLLPGAERPRRGDVAHLDYLINATWVEFPKRLDDDFAMRRLVWGITGVPSQTHDPLYAETVCPYRGLEAFRPEDAQFFFGRVNLTGWLVSALRREINSAGGVRLLGVLGPSGCGKSSVVMAGLVPRLRAGAIEGSEHWSIATMRPGDNPLDCLSESVVSEMRKVRTEGMITALREQDDLLRSLRSGGFEGATALHRYAGLKLANEPDDRRLLIIIDQFEEIFTDPGQGGSAQARFEHDRRRFLTNLLNASATQGGRVAVVLTMRSDFLSSCSQFPEVAAALSSHQELVGPMTGGEVREAIERPAQLVGCDVEPALTERLLSDVRGQSGALPLMQFALTEVWRRRSKRQLAIRAYEELGGIEGALEGRADEIYLSLSSDEQKLCQELFLRLVRPGEGTQDTKRRVAYGQLLPDDPLKADMLRRLIQILSDREARLITTDGTPQADSAVEVAHEALIRGWGRLRGWIEADRTGLITHRRLEEAARQWTEATDEAKDDYLYTGVRLAIATEWAEANPERISTVEKAFLSVSREMDLLRRQQELDAERRMREAAEAIANAERRQRRQWMGLAMAVVTVMLLGLVVVIPATQQWNRARLVRNWLDAVKQDYGLTGEEILTRDGYEISFSFAETDRSGGLPKAESLNSRHEALEVALDAAMANGLASFICGFDMSGCDLGQVPANIHKFTNLKTLDLSGNGGLTDLPVQIGRLENLTELDVGQTGLTRLPKSIGNLKKLRTLHAPRANLTELPDEVGDLTNLVSLHLSRNPLRTLPLSVVHLTELEELHLGNTLLTTIPDGIGSLSNLRILRLENTKLVAIPETIFALGNLKELNLPDEFRETHPDLVGKRQDAENVEESSARRRGGGGGGGFGGGRGGGSGRGSGRGSGGGGR